MKNTKSVVSELGFDRTATLETLANREVVQDLPGVNYADKALILKRCKEWTRRSSSTSDDHLSSFSPDLR